MLVTFNKFSLFQSIIVLWILTMSFKYVLCCILQLNIFERNFFFLVVKKPLTAKKYNKSFSIVPMSVVENIFHPTGAKHQFFYFACVFCQTQNWKYLFVFTFDEVLAAFLYFEENRREGTFIFTIKIHWVSNQFLW